MADEKYKAFEVYAWDNITGNKIVDDQVITAKSMQVAHATLVRMIPEGTDLNNVSLAIAPLPIEDLTN